MLNNFTKISKKRGYLMTTVAIMFVIISITIIFGWVNPLIAQIKNSKRAEISRQSYYLAEAGVEDVVYRLKKGMNVSSSETLSLKGEDVTISISDIVDGKIITAESSYKNNVRKVGASLVTGVGIAFNYGIQAGNGGFVMSNGSVIDGNVYSNGHISGSGSITGSAIAANNAPTYATFGNAHFLTPTEIIFGNSNSTQDVAQSFTVPETSSIYKIRFLNLRKFGSPIVSPPNFNVRIVRDVGGSPGTHSSHILAEALIATHHYANNTVSVDAIFNTNVPLEAGVKYWMVIDTSPNSNNYYGIGTNTAYGGDTYQAKIGRLGSSWNNTTPSGLDLLFLVYMGGVTSTISGVTIGGDAHANTVNGATVEGALYCKFGSDKAGRLCDTSKPDPAPQPYPISDGVIEFWKQEAEAGGVINGNYTPPSGSNVGPIKINGNLTISNDFYVTGTIWVTGNINASNNKRVKLHSSHGDKSEVLMADGYIDISNGMKFNMGEDDNGGVPGTYILVLSNSSCQDSSDSPCASNNSAIYVGNNAGAAILNAQKGKIHLKNNSSLKEATAYIIQLDNNAKVFYESGLASPNFDSGPSGGWKIQSWKEVE